MDNYLYWLENTKETPDIQRELITIEQDDAEREDRFYRALEFGTGGLRGVIGAGTNRMNKYIIRKATRT